MVCQRYERCLGLTGSWQNEIGVGIVNRCHCCVSLNLTIDFRYYFIFFSLSPKAYFAFDETLPEKRSSKGVQKRYRLTYDDYKRCLYEDNSIDATNISIRMFRGQMTTLAQRKAGLQNRMIKSYVHDDRVTVSPFKKFQ